MVDALRGVALLGIVIVNVEFIVQHADVGWSRDVSVLDVTTRWVVTTFGELKVYPLFALLFGYGLSTQLEHAKDIGADFGARYGRRMVGLVVLGIAHGVLFFPGDILVIYAAVGAVAFLLRRSTSTSLIRTAVIVYATAAIGWLLIGAAAWSAGADLAEPASMSSLRVLATGSVGEVIGQHLADWPTTVVFLAILQGPAAFGFALVGMVMGRTDILTVPDAHRAGARRVLAVGGPLGLTGAGIGAALTVRGGEFIGPGFAISFVAAPAMAAAYLAALMLAWQRVPALLSRLLRAAGRMSLSVYLLESVALSTLSYSYGLGLFGQLSPATGVLLAVSVWLGLCLFALAWLHFARFGPIEWVLRSFSYWHVQPLLARRRT